MFLSLSLPANNMVKVQYVCMELFLAQSAGVAIATHHSDHQV
jgi:hypothetical protein